MCQVLSGVGGRKLLRLRGFSVSPKRKLLGRKSISNPSDINWAVGITAACSGPLWGKKEGALRLDSVSP